MAGVSERRSSAGAGDASAGESLAQQILRAVRGLRYGSVEITIHDGEVVQIERRVPHPVYGKMVTRTRRVKAHDEENTAKTGDTVRIAETRPLSKDKRWRVVEIVERAR